MGLQLWASTRDGRVPAPEEAVGLLDRDGVVCRVGDLTPEELTVEAWFGFISMRQERKGALLLQAGGDEANRKDHEALGVSRGGFSTKIHLRAEGKGKPIAMMVTAGERHEQSVFEALMETAAIKRAGQGRPRTRPDRVVGDKGYSGKKIRTYLRKRGIGAVIARQKNERQVGHFDKEAYRECNVVERTINRLKQLRRVATRYEKRAVNYRAMLTIAAIVLWV